MAEDKQELTTLEQQLPEASEPHITKEQQTAMLADEDPLLISQSLTYVTDDGSILHSFQSAPFSMGKEKIFLSFVWY
jgi:hypothetical protein